MALNRVAAPFEWRKASPAAAGFTPDLEPRLDKLLADKRVWGLHGVLVIRGRKIVLERYFEGEDNNWGESLGKVRFGPDTLHNLYSATKSIVALLYRHGRKLQRAGTVAAADPRRPRGRAAEPPVIRARVHRP